MRNRLNELNFDTLSNDNLDIGDYSKDKVNDTSKYSDIYDNDYTHVKFNFKLILIGDIAVGKTSIFNRFNDNHFSIEYKCTINAHHKAKVITLNNKTIVNLQMWDTSGEEKYKAITRQYYNNAQGIMIVFDLSNRSTFDSVKKWMKEVLNYGPKQIEIIIIGNKSDLEERAVKTEEAQLYADTIDSSYIEVSAKNGTNILLLFELLATKMVQKFKVKEEEEEHKKQQKNSQLVLSANHNDSKAEKLIQSLKEREKKNNNIGCC